MSQFNDTLNKKAVALKYDDTQSAAPVIVASGMGYLAEKIVETALENQIPVYEDNSLATDVYKRQAYFITILRLLNLQPAQAV